MVEYLNIVLGHILNVTVFDFLMITSAEHDIHRVDQIGLTLGGWEVVCRGEGHGGKGLAFLGSLRQNQFLNTPMVGFSSTFQDSSRN